ncbi:DUF2865 domain-containing protein [Bosea sp. 685]|uniref:DUF2865 domain-containing protein n=1 Tax=Bosea sp. 685 TaxID=3080057 RepID=UPI002893367B|nr:DUF2865 domain-containing protein [Bosea sp. 685]WNJ92951.1 DUF2865 domain-containing protein [Bosea sp. 685]
MTGLGLALGAGGAIFTISLVQAEDDAGARAFLLQEGANRRAAQHAASVPAPPTAYAPARSRWELPLWRTQADGRIAQPTISLNPFRPHDAPAGVAKRQHARTQQARTQQAVRLDTVSGAADVARTICVRLCDGFHAPLGYLRSQSDMKAHEALCQAMNPGIPVKVFRVAAGAATIDEAQAADGKRYSALPVAHGHETSADPACRPAIVQAGERRVSLLRDFTLRPGDSVVLDGKVRTFTGGSRWPYSTSDFRDFRSASELSKGQRQQIDERVGISRMEAQARGLRRQMLLREASLHDDSVVSDAVPLRGTLDPTARGQARIIPIATSATQP